MSDAGKSENATGTAEQIAPGHLGPSKTFTQLRYTVARGDTLIGIDTRFQICRDDITSLNSDFDAFNLQPGRTLTLGRTSEEPFTETCA